MPLHKRAEDRRRVGSSSFVNAAVRGDGLHLYSGRCGSHRAGAPWRRSHQLAPPRLLVGQKAVAPLVRPAASKTSITSPRKLRA